MPACDLCGSKGSLFQAIIEGTTLTVCSSCSTLGKVVRPAPQQFLSRKESPRPVPDPTLHIIVGDYPRRIKACRERLGLSQKEFAAKLNLRESLIKHLEQGTIRPSLDLARTLERLLHITLIEKAGSPIAPAPAQAPSTDLTLGDIVQLRQR